MAALKCAKGDQCPNKDKVISVLYAGDLCHTCWQNSPIKEEMHAAQFRKIQAEKRNQRKADRIKRIAAIPVQRRWVIRFENGTYFNASYAYKQGETVLQFAHKYIDKSQAERSAKKHNGTVVPWEEIK